MSKQRIPKYFEQEIQALLARYLQFQTLLPSLQIKKDGESYDASAHNGEEGSYLENLVRCILKKYLPKELEVLNGFILRPEAVVGWFDRGRIDGNEGDQHSTQLDCIIYNSAKYPIFERYDDFVIVPPEGVVAIVSIKKTLRNALIDDELDALADAAYLCRDNKRRDLKAEQKELIKQGNEKFNSVNIKGPILSILTFTEELPGADSSAKSKNVTTKVKEYSNKYSLPGDAVIDLITVLDSFTILKGNPLNDREKGNFSSDLITFIHKTIIEREKEAKIEGEIKKALVTEELTHYHLGIQLLIRTILKNYYHESRSGELIAPGFNDFGTEIYVKKQPDKENIEFSELRVRTDIKTERWKYRKLGPEKYNALKKAQEAKK